VNGHGGQRRRGVAGGGEKIQWRNLWNEGTDAVMDIPIGGVCEVLYGEGRDPDPD
jgi:PIG-P